MFIKKALQLFWLCLCSQAMAAATDDCAGAITDKLEAVYCKVQLAGQGAGLPSLRDFRRNPPKTQRLLLRRPAARAGVDLPKQTPPSVPLAKQQASVAPTVGAAAEQCRIQADAITCGRQRYQLLDNLPNSRVNPAALTPAFRLHLPPFNGHVDDEHKLMSYLDDSYQRYLEAMVAIGLGASTMSFTKFYHTFLEVNASRADFSQRMATMFEYLKKDKKNIAVSAQSTDARPASMQQCRSLSAELWVCDDVKYNWLYRQVTAD